MSSSLVKGKLRSATKISGLFRRFFVEFDGQTSRSKFEQEQGQTDGRKWPKVSGDDDTAGITSMVPGVNISRLQNGLEFELAY